MEEETVDSDVAEVLERAADALWMYGRCKRFGTNDDGNLCVVGAIRFAQDQEPRHWTASYAWAKTDPAVIALEAHLNQQAYIWNDCLDLTPENDALVIDTLRHVAKNIRNTSTGT